LNRCRGFCRPLPNHSATPPDHPEMQVRTQSTRARNEDPNEGPQRADDGIRTRDPHLGKVAQAPTRYHRSARNPCSGATWVSVRIGPCSSSCGVCAAFLRRDSDRNRRAGGCRARDVVRPVHDRRRVRARPGRAHAGVLVRDGRPRAGGRSRGASVPAGQGTVLPRTHPCTSAPVEPFADVRPLAVLGHADYCGGASAARRFSTTRIHSSWSSRR
jgi:hypothetical protein